MTLLKKVIIAGGPRAGKTTLAREFGLVIKHSDDVRSMPWSNGSVEVATWFGGAGTWVVEGTAVPRALRKWLKDHPDPADRPCDLAIFVHGTRLELTPAQESMRKSCVTVWNEVKEELAARGVVIDETKGVGREVQRKVRQ